VCKDAAFGRCIAFHFVKQLPGDRSLPREVPPADKPRAFLAQDVREAEESFFTSDADALGISAA
jgi:hypothetical protein